MSYTIWPDGIVGEVLQAIYRERDRQDQLKLQGKFDFTCADKEMAHAERLSVITEEVGEVARAINERIGRGPFTDPELMHLGKELVQVAAVAVAWCEAITNELHERASLARRGELAKPTVPPGFPPTDPNIEYVTVGDADKPCPIHPPPSTLPVVSCADCGAFRRGPEFPVYYIHERKVKHGVCVKCSHADNDHSGFAPKPCLVEGCTCNALETCC